MQLLLLGRSCMKMMLNGPKLLKLQPCAGCADMYRALLWILPSGALSINQQGSTETGSYKRIYFKKIYMFNHWPYCHEFSRQ